MVIFDIHKMTAVKAGLLMSVADAGSPERVSNIAERSEHQKPVVIHNMRNMEIDGWIQGTQQLKADVLVELTRKGENLVELIEFGQELNETLDGTGDD